MKVAVVTPYFNEPVEVLRRCHDSVLRQTHACTHIMVADGRPRAEVAGWDVQHVVLPASHADYGNTPRGLGGLSAFNRGFDAVAYLDADNWYAEDHVEAALPHVAAGADAVISDMHFVLPTGERIENADPDLAARRTADTNCYLFARGAARLAAAWAQMPSFIAPMGDRLMLRLLRHWGVPHAWTGRKTVFYETRWPRHYRAAGLTPPPDARTMDLSEVQRAYSGAEMIARFGFDPFPQPDPETLARILERMQPPPVEG